MSDPAQGASRSIAPWLWWLTLVAVAVAFSLRGEAWLRRLLIYLSGAGWARDAVTRLPLAWQAANRFVSGETRDEAMRVTRALNDQGLLVTLDFLGESVADAVQAAAARDEILALLDAIAAEGVEANVSLKLTQLGMKIDPALAESNLCLILERARRYGNRVRIDMEDSPWTDTTLAIYRALRDEHGYDNTGVVIQSYLFRSAADVERLVAEGAWVRLCKGAYAEPPEVAYPRKADTDASFVRLMRRLLSAEARRNGVYAGIATHDDRMIAATQAFARDQRIPLDAFEFQMLYGIRRERQLELAAQGYRLRVYVPYGTAWYPYYMRRLAERPANIWFFLSNLRRR